MLIMVTQISTEQLHRQAARKAGLRYVNDNTLPGISRSKTKNGFSYRSPDGSLVKDKDTLDRIKKLVIPPAWEDVWISPHENGHIQVTGRDIKGRKQYRYHADWIKLRSETKFSRMLAFAEALPGIRKRVDADLAARGITQDKVVATVIRLMEKSYIRIGNAEYAKQNNSFGLTTLRDKHVQIKGDTIKMQFTGKKGVKHDISLSDRRLARLVKQCRDIPGYELFQYYDDEGQRHAIDSGDVNDYLRSISGEDFTAKDFRTWAGSVEALSALRDIEHTEDEKERKRILVGIIKDVAESLGNTPAVCRKYYIHPRIMEAYEKGRLHDFISSCKVRSRKYFSFEECMLVKFLEENER